MSNLLSTNDLTFFSGAFADHFDTFSPYVDITVFKEPIQTITADLNSDVYLGNSEDQINTTFTPVSRTFKGILKTKNQNINKIDDLNLWIGKGDAYIKVNEDAKNYITEGKTELIQANGKSYNVLSLEKPQNYLGLKYYYFSLNETK